MKSKIIIYESPRIWDLPFIYLAVWQKKAVYAIEPFYAYHYRGTRIFFPFHLPDYIKKLIQRGAIGLIHQEQIQARTIFLEVCDRAVDAI
ncbi:MAG: hypothetical protein NUV91_00445, partial [Candidatus Omnitrophica bacterium]|nr:hypothetical protein [Candidatus Omnitrophota bacterium]